ncbi:MAG: photosynthetic complex putative assembly protein PuhB [Pseudomonadota bacterium]
MDHDTSKPSKPTGGSQTEPREDERILWQGKPDWLALANDALFLRWVVIYFVMLALWRGLAGWLNHDVERGIASATLLIGIGAVCCGLIALFAWTQARATTYTVTNRRIVMHIGAVLGMALNIPYRRIVKASLKSGGHAGGTIMFDLSGESGFSYLACWPHVRPWYIRRTQPAFRSIPDAEAVMRLIGAHSITEADERPAELQTAPIPAE